MKAVYISVTFLVIFLLGSIVAEVYLSGKVKLEPSILNGSPNYQFILKPGINVSAISPEEYAVNYTINEQGFRSPNKFSKKSEDSFRILGLGDSFIFGMGVDEDKAFIKKLSTYLEDNTKKIEVLNTGTPGWGTSHALRFIEREALNLKPDLIVLGLYVGNDFRNNLNQGMYSVENHNLVQNKEHFNYFLPEARKIEKIPFYNWLSQNSSLVNFLRKKYSDWVLHNFYENILNSLYGLKDVRDVKDLKISKYKVKEYENFKFDQHVSPEIQSSKPDELLITKLLLEKLTQKIKKQNISFVLVMIPGNPGEDTDNIYIKDLSLFCRIKGWNCVDMAEVFERRGLPIDQQYFKSDGHWRAESHEIAAQELAKLITEIPLDGNLKLTESLLNSINIKN